MRYSQDLGIEQLVPVKALGKKYLMSKTKSRNNSNNYRVGIVVTAVEEGTAILSMDHLIHYQKGVRFHRIPNFNNNGTGNVSGGPMRLYRIKNYSLLIKLLGMHKLVKTISLV